MTDHSVDASGIEVHWSVGKGKLTAEKTFKKLRAAWVRTKRKHLDFQALLSTPERPALLEAVSPFVLKLAQSLEADIVVSLWRLVEPRKQGRLTIGSLLAFRGNDDRLAELVKDAEQYGSKHLKDLRHKFYAHEDPNLPVVLLPRSKYEPILDKVHAALDYYSSKYRNTSIANEVFTPPQNEPDGLIDTLQRMVWIHLFLLDLWGDDLNDFRNAVGGDIESRIRADRIWFFAQELKKSLPPEALAAVQRANLPRAIRARSS